MKYYDLKQKLTPLVVFSLQDIYLADPEFRQPTLYDWEKVGKVVRLRNDRYVFAEFQPEDSDYYLISNKLYQPSYVSTELALNHYGVIPELVVSITAVSTNKTQTFATTMGNFVYQTIKPELYFGYNLIQIRDRGVSLASLEKAVLDYLYLNPSNQTLVDFVELRWNKQILNDNLDLDKLNRYLSAYTNQALTQKIKILQEYIVN